MKDRLPEHVEPSEPWSRPGKDINDGGPAYPCTKREMIKTISANEREIEVVGNVSYPGMNLRDRIALEVLETLIKEELKPHPMRSVDHTPRYDRSAYEAVQYADALIKELSK